MLNNEQWEQFSVIFFTNFLLPMLHKKNILRSNNFANDIELFIYFLWSISTILGHICATFVSNAMTAD